jgi:hypothetical protein
MAKRLKSELVEIFVTVFPCGAFRAVRTEQAAISTGAAMAAERVCCGKGHDTFQVFVYVKSAKLADFQAEPKTVRQTLRLVKR